MCGIWGFIGGSAGVPIADAREGLRSLTDRGPDDWGMYVGGSGKVTDESAVPDGSSETVLGSRRLSILDLSAAGNQPMEGDGCWIVYNGEVYNYRELRETLRGVGYEFSSDTDTEVVLRAYQEYGPDCVSRFRGMFAFAIWDERRNRLFAARDRFGIKPLYFDVGGGRLAFASEVTALLNSGVTARELDLTSVDGFLALGSVPSPRTIIDGVRSLPPASTLTYVPGDDGCSIDRYWRPTFEDEQRSSPARVRDLLRESVSLRLRSDVPVGAFLSGGLDSSTVVALMNETRTSDEPLHTFSVGFEEGGHSETDFASTVASAFGTEHTAHTVTAPDVRDRLPDIIASMDQPTIDGVNTYFVSEATADAGIRVALSGLGSDELFYGYPTFERVRRLSRFGQAVGVLPLGVRDAFGRWLDGFGRVVPHLPFAELADVLRSSSPFGAGYLAARGLFTVGQRDRLLDGRPDTDWGEAIEGSVEETLAESGVTEAVSRAELAWYMHNQLLRDTDVMSMTHSLEVRVPFLDADLVDAITGTSPEAKRAGEKHILKRTVDTVVPDAVLEREKSGFTFPFAEWLDDDLAPTIDHALDDERLGDTPLSAHATRQVRRGFEDGRTHWSRLWALVVLSLWIEEHITT